MNYWLMKSEPEEFSISDLERVGREPWSGVRNYQARNYMRDGMRVGDGILFYHSNCEVPGVVGLAKVASQAHADPTQFDPESDYFDPRSSADNPRWLMVDVGFAKRFARTVSLDELRGHAEELGDFALIRRGNRLSVLPVEKHQWQLVKRLASKKA